MPDIGSLHPKVVHFVIALLFLGVITRVVSLLWLRRGWNFLRPMGAVVILLGTGAAVVAVQSGDDAHRVVEQIPGARNAVEEHEDWGNRTRNLFLLVSALEIAALVAGSRKPRVITGLLVVSAAVGVAGLFVVYETGEHGGSLVYEYAGGVGTWSGDSADVRRLLAAGLFQNARQARADGLRDDASRLTEQLAHLMPRDPSVRLLWAQSLLHDRRDPGHALAALDSLNAPASDRGLRIRKGLLTAEALDSAGMRDSARATLQSLNREFPNVQSVVAALKQVR